MTYIPFQKICLNTHIFNTYVISNNVHYDKTHVSSDMFCILTSKK